jgi:hypothetical protein
MSMLPIGGRSMAHLSIIQHRCVTFDLFASYYTSWFNDARSGTLDDRDVIRGHLRVFGYDHYPNIRYDPLPGFQRRLPLVHTHTHNCLSLHVQWWLHRHWMARVVSTTAERNGIGNVALWIRRHLLLLHKLYNH